MSVLKDNLAFIGMSKSNMSGLNSLELSIEE